MTGRHGTSLGALRDAARDWRVETWSTIILSALVCAFIAWMHLAHQREIAETARRLDFLRVARIELSQGLLMVGMADRPGSPYQREHGLALIRQALGSFDKVARDSGLGSEAQRSAFQRDIGELQAVLAGWDHSAAARRMVAALVAQHRLEMQASGLDTQAREALLATSARFQRLFLGALLGSSLLLGLLCAHVYFAGRARRAAEQARLAVAQRHAITLRSIGDGVIVTDGQGNVDLLNAVAESLTGWTDSEAHGRSLAEVFRIIRDGTRESIQNPVAEVLGSGRTVALANDTLLLNRGGGERHIADSAAPIRDERGEIAGVVLVFRDQTVEKRIKKALRDSEAHFRALADFGQALIWSAGTDKLCNYFNKTWLAFTGRSLEQELGNGWAEGVHPDDFERCLEIYVRSFDRREAFSMEYRLRHHSGEYRWIVDQGTPRYDSEGVFIGYIGHCLDITGRINAEAALLASEQKLRSLFRSMSDVILILDAEGRYLEVAPTNADRLFRPPAELMGKSVADIFPQEQAQYFIGVIRRALALGTAVSVDYSLEIAGRECWFSGHVSPLSADRVIWVARDITDRKRFELALAEREGQLRLFVEHAPAAIAMFDQEMRYLAASRRWCEDYALADCELEGRGHYEIFPEIPERWREIHRRCLAGAVEQAQEDPFLRADGRTQWVSWEIRPWFANDGRVGGIVCFSEDVTVRKQAQQALLEAKEAAEAASQAKSEFLANMSHEIRTPLNGLLGMIQLIRGGSVPPDVEMYADMALRAGNRLTSLLGDILDLSRIEAGRMPIQSKPFSLKSVTEAMTETFSPVNFSSRVKLRLEVARDVPDGLLGDEVRVRQVLFNLVGNAMKFTEQGEVRVGVSLLRPHPSGAQRLLFIVSDDGVGIPAEQMAEIFNPFTQAAQSVSKARQGAGLGLAITQRLVKAMGGSLAFDSTKGQGTDVYLVLPFARTAGPAGAEEAAAGPAAAPPLRILLVEDEEISRISASVSLARAGHAVEAAASGQEALEILGRKRFDCVLMDVQMQGLDGVAVTRLIRQGAEGVLDPDVPVIAMTAYAMAGDRERFLEAGMNDYVAKPVRQEDLARALARVAARR